MGLLSATALDIANRRVRAAKFQGEPIDKLGERGNSPSIQPLARLMKQHLDCHRPLLRIHEQVDRFVREAVPLKQLGGRMFEPMQVRFDEELPSTLLEPVAYARNP
jgi:hypothetical protein